MARRVGGHHFLGEVLLAADAHGGGEAGATLAEPPRCPLSLSRVGSESWLCELCKSVNLRA